MGFRDRGPYFVGVRLGTEAIRQSHQTHYLYTHHTDTPSIWQMHWRYVVALCLCDFLEIDGVTKKSHTDCRECTHGSRSRKTGKCGVFSLVER